MVIFDIANCTMNVQKEQESFSKLILYVSRLYFSGFNKTYFNALILWDTVCKKISFSLWRNK